MNSFSIAVPGRILFGRGEAAKAPGLIAAFGARGIVVHGADAARAGWLMQGLRAAGCEALGIACAGEPVLAVLEQAVAQARAHRPDWIVALGGGAALDLGKAIAALVPAPGEAMDYLEVVGRGLPLEAAPLPFIALPSTAGTGAEVTKNAVIGVPAQGRKVSLRDDRMLVVGEDSAAAAVVAPIHRLVADVAGVRADGVAAVAAGRTVVAGVGEVDDGDVGPGGRRLRGEAPGDQESQRCERQGDLPGAAAAS